MVSYLQVENVTKSFGDLVLFENISFGISEGQKIGLIARNGAGKSTLLSILAGDEGKDSGNVTYRNGLKVGYLKQQPVYPPEMTVLEACFHSNNALVELVAEYERVMESGRNQELDEILIRMDMMKAWDYESRVKQILSQLKITNYEQTIKTLSGGQLKRVALANVLIAEPDLLIMDEPTNHLDLEMTEWLEEYLRRAKLSLLMVTHDRYFLDRVCAEILEIDDKRIYQYKGNYSYYLEKRDERLHQLNVEVEKANNLYRTELEWMRRMPQARGHKARYREEAFYELEKVAKRNLSTQYVKLEVKASYIGKKIFEVDQISKHFGDNIIVENFSYIFARYEKMGIIGNNGVGKSTFIKLILGLLPPDKGVIEIGETVRFGYYSQEGLEFDEQMKVIDVVRDKAEVIELGNDKRLSASQFLQHFMFSPEKQHSYVYKLSGGEKRRLYLCTVLMQNPNFLILDEPTNDLDIVTLNVLENYLANFKGCVMVVSHDRYFMDKVVDHLLVFNGQGDIRDFPGNYTDYRMWKEVSLQRKKDDKPKKNEKTVQSVTEEQPRKKKTYKEKLEFADLEKELETLEQEKAQIEEKLCSGNLSSDQLTEYAKKAAVLIDQIDQKTMRWLELSELAD